MSRIYPTHLDYEQVLKAAEYWRDGFQKLPDCIQQWLTDYGFDPKCDLLLHEEPEEWEQGQESHSGLFLTTGSQFFEYEIELTENLEDVASGSCEEAKVPVSNVAKGKPATFGYHCFKVLMRMNKIET